MEIDLNTIIELISTVGFPIVCCGAMFWYMLKTNEKHKEEMDKITEALNNNTKALLKLCGKLNVTLDEDEVEINE